MRHPHTASQYWKLLFLVMHAAHHPFIPPELSEQIGVVVCSYRHPGGYSTPSETGQPWGAERSTGLVAFRDNRSKESRRSEAHKTFVILGFLGYVP